MKLLIIFFVSSIAAESSYGPYDVLRHSHLESTVDDLKELIRDGNSRGFNVEWDNGLEEKAKSTSCDLKSDPPLVKVQVPDYKAPPKSDGDLEEAMKDGYVIGCAARADCKNTKFMCLLKKPSSGSSFGSSSNNNQRRKKASEQSSFKEAIMEGFKEIAKKNKKIDIKWDDGLEKEAETASCEEEPSASLMKGRVDSTNIKKGIESGELNLIGCSKRPDCRDKIGFEYLCLFKPNSSASSSGSSSGPSHTLITYTALLAVLSIIYF